MLSRLLALLDESGYFSVGSSMYPLAAFCLCSCYSRCVIPRNTIVHHIAKYYLKEDSTLLSTMIYTDPMMDIIGVG